ncbi:MAG: hypothetical protein IH845_05770 [Nanoarchaeota archaeon]|nr:hypothetical protein [Nanoarchaeota archaeon]
MKRSNIILIGAGMFSLLMGSIFSSEFGFLSFKFNIYGIFYIVSLYLAMLIGLNVERESRTKEVRKR